MRSGIGIKRGQLPIAEAAELGLKETTYLVGVCEKDIEHAFGRGRGQRKSGLAAYSRR